MVKNIFGKINSSRFDKLRNRYFTATRFANEDLDNNNIDKFRQYQEVAYITYLELRSMIKFD